MENEEILDEVKTMLPEGVITLGEFVDKLSDEYGDDALKTVSQNANRAVTRGLFKDVFRITQAFCKKQGYLPLMKEESWYQVARLIANSLSHNFRIEYRQNDRKYLPLEYNGIVLKESDQGKPIKLDLDKLFDLTEKIITFVNDRLD